MTGDRTPRTCSRLRRCTAIRNRFAIDVMLDVDEDQLDDARAFGDGLLALALAPADRG